MYVYRRESGSRNIRTFQYQISRKCEILYSEVPTRHTLKARSITHFTSDLMFSTGSRSQTSKSAKQYDLFRTQIPHEDLLAAVVSALPFFYTSIRNYSIVKMRDLFYFPRLILSGDR